MKTLPCALCRPSIVTMMRAADAGPAMKISARAEEKNRLRQRMLGVCSLGVVHLSRVAKILLSTGLKVGAERCHARSRQIRVLGSHYWCSSANVTLGSIQGHCVSLVRPNRESRVK